MLANKLSWIYHEEIKWFKILLMNQVNVYNMVIDKVISSLK